MNNSRVAGYTGGEEVSNQGSSSAHNAVCLFIRSRDRISRPRTIEYICILIRARVEPPARLYLTKKKRKNSIPGKVLFFLLSAMTASSFSFKVEGVGEKKKGFLSLLHPLPPMIPLIIRT